MGSQVEKMAKPKIFGRNFFVGIDSERSKTYFKMNISNLKSHYSPYSIRHYHHITKKGLNQRLASLEPESSWARVFTSRVQARARARGFLHFGSILGLVLVCFEYPSSNSCSGSTGHWKPSPCSVFGSSYNAKYCIMTMIIRILDSGSSSKMNRFRMVQNVF